MRAVEQAGVPGVILSCMVLVWHSNLVPACMSQDGVVEAGPAALGAHVRGKPLIPFNGAKPAHPQALADTERVSMDHSMTFLRTLMTFPRAQGRGGRAPGGNQ